MKKLLFGLLLIFLSNGIFCQDADSASKFNFGWQLVTGMEQQDFSGLRHYDYLFDAPQNISYLYPVPSVFIGNPQKFFFSAFIGTNITGIKKSTYNTYSVSSSGTSGFEGFSIGIPLATHLDKKGLQGIYLMVGGKYIKETISSEATGINPNQHDTTFYFENSKARVFTAKIEFMLEFSRKTNRTAMQRIPFTFKAGYDFQLMKPTWSGDYSRAPGDENPDINLGGWYLSAGFNFWTAKGFWKSAFRNKTNDQ